MGNNILTTSTAPASGTRFVPERRTGAPLLQASIIGSGAVTATVDVYASVGDAYAKLFSISLSGTGSDSSIVALNVSSVPVKATCSAISGTGAIVTVDLG